LSFLVDECCDADLVEALRADGHNVLYVMESMRGAADSEILTRAFAEERVLLTEDKDFGELTYRLRQPAFGIVLLRFGTKERALKISCLRNLIRLHGERLQGHFIVLDAEKHRIRPIAAHG
jgi:predicted nuclease of predicted toxin-antitoxin system